MRTTALLASTLLLTFAACSDDTGADDGGVDDDASTTDAAPNPDAVPSPDATVHDAGPPPDATLYGGVDIVFVIDNSGTMAEEQAALATSIGTFITSLEAANGGTLPSLHIGVVSTNIGAGPFNIQGCGAVGDNGVFQNLAQGQCNPPQGSFIVDLVNPDMSRQRNYTGNLDEVFSCIAVLGIDGCGFEQPLESMRLALNGTNPQNNGFLRDDALLAVVIVSDEDDCSAEDTQVFDTSQNDINDPLGPLSSFRCFEFGVECNPDDPRTVGAKANCVSREDSQYMYPVQDYVDFLQTLKPGNVVVATIQGNPTPVAVGSNPMGNPELSPSCVSAAGEADPGVRLNQFLAGFPGANAMTTICDQMSTSLQGIAQLIASHL